MLDEITDSNVCVICLESLYQKGTNLLEEAEDNELALNEIGNMFWNFFNIENEISYELASTMKICETCENQLNTSTQFMLNGKESFEKFKSFIESDVQKNSEVKLNDADDDKSDNNSDLYVVEYLHEEDDSVTLDEILGQSDQSAEDIQEKNELENEEDDEEELYLLDDSDSLDKVIDETVEEENDEITENKKKVPGQKKTKNIQRYNCEKCDKRFLNTELFEAHMNKHQGLPGFTCKLCGKTFNIKFRYEVHLRQHNNIKPHICYICGKGCSTAADLRIHLRMHYNIRDFICQVCGKGFHTSSNLKKHTRVHTKEKPFVCTICKSAFTDSSTLKVHVTSIHLKLHSYACEVCGRKFKRKHHLKTHGKVHERKNRIKDD